jgi:tRNA(Ile)-lysidine synthase
MNLIQHFKYYISNNNLFSPKDKLLLAVSGGVDSIVLCELCKQAGYVFIIAHCNFQLRGEESERDEKFVKELAAKYKVDFFSKTFDTKAVATQQKKSIEETARYLRYEWFEELRTQKKCDRIVTAHHADDNIETIAMKFFRGTGLKGLTGIKSKNGNIVRPLLFARKNELEDFGLLQELKFVQDHTNFENDHTRNFFRNKLIPLFRSAYPGVELNLLNNIERFTEIEKLYRLSVGDIKKKLVKLKGKEWHIPIKQLMGYNNRALIYEVIVDFGFTEKQIDEVIKLSESESGKYIDSPTSNYRLIRHRQWFIISSVNSAESATIIIEEKDKQTIFEEGTLQLEKPQTSNLKRQTSNNIAQLDAKEISFPLLLRKWKTGDYFYPLGMKKKKKLSRFFIDQKLSKTEKEKAWVIEMNKKIIWVVGHRIDDRFKISDNTNSVLQISITK